MLKYGKIVLLFCGLYLIFITLFSRGLGDNDLWGNLAFGKIIWNNAILPTQDVFAYTPTKDYIVYHEWLTAVVFYFIHHISGPIGLQFLRYVIIILTLCLIYATAVKKGAYSVAALIVLIPAMLLISFGYLPVRAQIWTYLFFILTIYILETAIRENKWRILWFLIPIQILWCNLHGGFVAGLGIIFLYTVGEAISKRKFMPLAMMLVLATLATLINPYGFTYWKFTVHAVTMHRPDIQEWMSVFAAWKHQYQNVPIIIFFSCAIIYILALILNRRGNITDLLVAAVMLYLGFKHIRHTVFFGLVFGAFLPAIISELWKRWKRKDLFFTRLSVLPQILLGLIMILLLIKPFAPLSLRPTFLIVAAPPFYPMGAIKWIIDNDIKGNILPEFDWGEFIIWTTYPACRVAMDGRYETVYQEELVKEYFTFLRGTDKWRQFLLKYPHNMVLVRKNSQIYQLMMLESFWHVVYSDDVSAVFMKK